MTTLLFNIGFNYAVFYSKYEDILFLFRVSNDEDAH
jgi:hypothetical protein